MSVWCGEYTYGLLDVGVTELAPSCTILSPSTVVHGSCDRIHEMSLEQLRELLDRHARPDGTTTIEGVRVCRNDHPGGPETAMSGTVVAIIAQGRKRLALGERVVEYGAGQYLIASVDLPLTGHFVDTAPGEASLGFAMALDPSAIAELLLAAGPGDVAGSAVAPGPALGVSDTSDELLCAVVRLLRLLDRPRDRTVLAPLFKREILWRLMTGEQGHLVRQLGLADSGLSHIRRAVVWIRENYAKPFRVEEVARLSGMSVSAFHRNFQAVTATTPIQFQKHIRLQVARLMLADHPRDIASVSHRVGYDNPSQFSREYRRQFGVPPSIDASRMRGGAPRVATVLP